jgi:hypothetical protein
MRPRDAKRILGHLTTRQTPGQAGRWDVYYGGDDERSRTDYQVRRDGDALLLVVVDDKREQLGAAVGRADKVTRLLEQLAERIASRIASRTSQGQGDLFDDGSSSKR